MLVTDSSSGIRTGDTEQKKNNNTKTNQWANKRGAQIIIWFKKDVIYVVRARQRAAIFTARHLVITLFCYHHPE
jgi:hypothetical protein